MSLCIPTKNHMMFKSFEWNIFFGILKKKTGQPDINIYKILLDTTRNTITSYGIEVTKQFFINNFIPIHWLLNWSTESEKRVGISIEKYT